MNDSAQSAEPLSPDAQRLLGKVRERQNSHPKFKAMLAMTDDQYDAAKRELLANQLVRPLQCFRGGLRLLAAEADLPQIDKAQLEKAKQVDEESERQREALAERLEKDFYPYVQRWADLKGYDYVSIVGDCHRRETWENPDLIALTINEFEWLVGREIEITTIEVKPSFAASAIWQAAHYRSFSHYVYLACNESHDDIREKADGRLLEMAVALGLGIISMTASGMAGKGIRCVEIHCAARQSPRLAEIEKLLSDYHDLFPDVKKVGDLIVSQMALR